MGGDDFARYAEISPGAFAFLGVGGGGVGGGGVEEETYPLHHPKFNVGGADILNGTKVMAALICEFAG